ncbi:MAG: DUF1929 domain-containing protein [Planctomycetes bacterium]|nr:DUF1929 domain-containing protein [Planctomycetota bacterium]
MHGQWAGPYDLTQITSEHPNVPLHEITHAVVLPDVEGEVLFWCHVWPTSFDTSAHGGLPGPTHTFRWSPRVPQSVTKIDVPNNFNGSEDLFCGGHQFLADGDVLAFGGTDMTSTSVITGHASAFRFDLTTQSWQTAGVMHRERWYPNAFPTPFGLMVLGHTEHPVYSVPTEKTHDRFFDSSGTWDAPTGAAQSRLRNVFDVLGSPCGITSNLVEVHDYPRCHLLANALELRYMELETTQQDWQLDFTTGCLIPPAERWHLQSGPLNVQHKEASTAHFVILGAGGVALRDHVIVAAGQERTTTYVAQTDVDVWSQVGTTPGAWSTAFPDLNEGRVDQNLVILADGSMLVVGGADVDALTGNQTAARLNPERFMSTHATNFPLPDTGDAWLAMAPQQHERRYHSVAGLLPDGRVFSAGGAYPYPVPSPLEPSSHSVEIYSPPYLFKGARPAVSGLSSTTWTPTPFVSQESFTIQFRPGSTLEHVALIKTGSITHAFDSSQRYVVLHAVIQPDPVIADKYSVTVDVPPSHFATPKGDYMLVAVSSLGVPSIAKMIQIN